MSLSRSVHHDNEPRKQAVGLSRRGIPEADPVLMVYVLLLGPNPAESLNMLFYLKIFLWVGDQSRGLLRDLRISGCLSIDATWLVAMSRKVRPSLILGSAEKGLAVLSGAAAGQEVVIKGMNDGECG